MKIKYKRLLAGVLISALCLSAAGCKQEQKIINDSVYMNYATGVSENGEYNTKLYGMNGVNDVHGNDPGVMYVSKEEDPEWGGYFYMYPGGFAIGDEGAQLTDDYYTENHIQNYMGVCFRSPDMYNWERVGTEAKGKYVCTIDDEDWCDNMIWAPEVIRNPADGKYYMYCNATIKQDWGIKGFSNSSNRYDRFYICIAVSDTPIGPFDVLYDTDAETGKRIPTINFQTGCNTKYPWSVIDISPFFDDNGDFYLYFNKHTDDHYTFLNGVWGVKMTSMTTADYSTVSVLTQPTFVTASNVPGKIEQVTKEGDYWKSEGGINEAPFMLKHNGKYYITYASEGYGSISYSVHQAISDNPLSGFVKVDADKGNPILDGSVFSQMHGTAHHAFVTVGNETFICYHRHNSITVGANSGRSIDVDRINFITNSDGVEVMTANGPSYTLQWLPEAISGYKDLARTADIRISTGTGAEYLNDRILPYYQVAENAIMSMDGDPENRDLTITMKWNEPVSVSSVMVYNSAAMETAFSKISQMKFKLAEKPDWADKDYKYAVVKDLEFPSIYFDPDSEDYSPCAPAVAEFSPIKVTEIVITIKGEDRLVEFDRAGNENLTLNLSEIVVLGGK